MKRFLIGLFVCLSLCSCISQQKLKKKKPPIIQMHISIEWICKRARQRNIQTLAACQMWCKNTKRWYKNKLKNSSDVIEACKEENKSQLQEWLKDNLTKK